jgi:diguanylate cyclase
MTVNNHTKEIALAEKTLTELKKYNIPPTPKCYEVMYTFLKEDNLEVTNAVNKYLNAHDTITEVMLLKIHTSILSYDTIARTVNIVTDLLNKQLNRLDDTFSSSNQEIDVFSDAITSFNQHIDNEDNGVIENNIIDYISEATSRIKNKIHELSSNLNASQDEIRKLQSYLENVCQESMIDPLTSLTTRKKSDQILSQSIRNSIETSEEMSLILMEIDHFEEFNEKWGYVTSEQILRFIAFSLKENIKGRDTASRFGTYLFLIILPKTELEGACILAEHIRNTIEKKRIIKKTTGEFLGRVTVSSGVTQFKNGDSIGYLMSRVENALNFARQNGRNCTISEIDIEKNNLANNQESKAS